jgi:hypothetical protein
MVVVGRKREHKERALESRVVKSLLGGAEWKRGRKRRQEPPGGRGSQVEQKKGKRRHREPPSGRGLQGEIH